MGTKPGVSVYPLPCPGDGYHLSPVYCHRHYFHVVAAVVAAAESVVEQLVAVVVAVVEVVGVAAVAVAAAAPVYPLPHRLVHLVSLFHV